MLMLHAWCARYEWHSRGWFDQVVKGVVHVFCMSFKLAERCTHPVRPLQIDCKYFYFRLKQFYFWSTHFLLKTPSVRVFCRLMLPPGRCLLPLCMHFVQKCGKRRVQNAKPTASILLLLVVDYIFPFSFFWKKKSAKRLMFIDYIVCVRCMCTHCSCTNRIFTLQQSFVYTFYTSVALDKAHESIFVGRRCASHLSDC